MSKIFEEALADAKKLKEVAEANAKKAILESVTPKIKEFIENQILEQENKIDKTEEDSIIDEEDISDPVTESLLEMIAGKDFINKFKNKNKLNEAFEKSFDNLKSSEQLQMKKLIKKISKEKNNLKSRNIINSVNTIQENNQMKNREKFYEIDLALLREAVEDQKTDLAMKEMEKEEEEKNNESFLDDLNEYSFLFEEDSEDADEDSEEPSEDMDMDMDMADLAPAGDEDEDGVMLPMDLAKELQSILDAEIGGAAGGAALADLDVEEPSEEEPSEDEGEKMNEVFDVDPRMLREEIANVRRMLGEGKMDHHFGGKGSGSAGHKNAFGGTGPKKAGYQNSFGGGSYGKDIFVTPPSTLKKLNEAIQQLRKLSRMNRAQNEKLNKYRGAVQTLREQLEDLNLFNAKLLYVNKLLQNKSLNESQKKSVIKALDEAKSLGETKALFKSLTESLSTGKSSLNESTRFGSSSRATTSGSAPKNDVVGESDRWAKLAGLK